MRKKEIVLLLAALLVYALAACGSTVQKPDDSAFTQTESARPSNTERPEQSTGTDEMDNQNNTEKQTEMKMNVEVGGTVFSATLESNSAVDALVEMMREAPVAIQMNDYSGFEKVGSLGMSLPTSNSQTTTHAGDIVLYNGNQIVIFYGSNSWNYTQRAHRNAEPFGQAHDVR